MTDRLYGGIALSWPMVIILAVASAVITAVFLIVPVFKDTSFERMGVQLEAWFFIAIFIMPNCKSAVDSALKTFVFFLISQPLIYLFQVPFSDMGWSLFGYYKNWFFLTLCTFPMAFVGWYIRKRNWLGTLIIAPVLAFLTVVGAGALRDTITDPPYLLVTAIFCLGQVVLYAFVFTGDKWQRLAACAVIAVSAVVFVALYSKIEVNGQAALPDGYSYSESAELTVEENDFVTVELIDAESGFVRVHATKYGTATFTVKDGDKSDTFTITVSTEHGISNIRIEIEK